MGQNQPETEESQRVAGVTGWLGRLGGGTEGLGMTFQAVLCGEREHGEGPGREGQEGSKCFSDVRLGHSGPALLTGLPAHLLAHTLPGLAGRCPGHT